MNTHFIYSKLAESFRDLCNEMLSDKQLERIISDEKFDLAVTDGLEFFRCLTVIPYRHNIRYVTISPRHDPWTARVGTSPAAEGNHAFVPYLTPEDPGFFDRFRAVLMEIGRAPT